MKEAGVRAARPEALSSWKNPGTAAMKFCVSSLMLSSRVFAWMACFADLKQLALINMTCKSTASCVLGRQKSRCCAASIMMASMCPSRRPSINLHRSGRFGSSVVADRKASCSSCTASAFEVSRSALPRKRTKGKKHGGIFLCMTLAAHSMRTAFACRTKAANVAQSLKTSGGLHKKRAKSLPESDTGSKDTSHSWR